MFVSGRVDQREEGRPGAFDKGETPNDRREKNGGPDGHPRKSLRPGEEAEGQDAGKERSQDEEREKNKRR